MRFAVDLDGSPSINHERLEEAKEFVISNYQRHATIRLRRRYDHNYFYCFSGPMYAIVHESLRGNEGEIIQQPVAIPIENLDDGHASGLFDHYTETPLFSNLDGEAVDPAVYDRVEIVL